MKDLYRKLGVERSASPDTIRSALNARRFTLAKIEIDNIEFILLNGKRRKRYDPAHKTMQTIVDIRARIISKKGSWFDSELAHDFIPTPNPKKQAGESQPQKPDKSESTKSNQSHSKSNTYNSKKTGQAYRPKPQKQETVKQSAGHAYALLGCLLMLLALFVLIVVGLNTRAVPLPTEREDPKVTWTDNTGQFSVIAKYIDVRDKKVVLLKEDGNEIEVPLNRLSISSWNLAKDYYERNKIKSKESRPVGISKLFSGRTGTKKALLLTKFGGTRQTQEAVKRGLDWLRSQQAIDGSWSMRGPYDDGGFTENKTAATAMALLAFLGDGHTHQNGDYRAVVDRGMNWLIKQQDMQGFFAKNARSHERMYAQAQASIAICELYGLTADSWLRPHAQQTSQKRTPVFKCEAKPEAVFVDGLPNVTALATWLSQSLSDEQLTELALQLHKVKK